MNNLGFKHA